jgi:hypothetical protein
MRLTKEKLFAILQSPVMWKSNDILANCPKCNAREFYISLNDNHPFNCVRKKRCGFQGNIYTLLNHLGISNNQDFKEPVLLFKEINTYLLIENDSQTNIDLDEVKLPIGFKRVFNDEYLQTRGFLKDDYNDYYCGITKLDRKLINYIIFVIYQDFKPVATIGRYKGSKKDVDEKKLPRYKNSDSNFSKILGGYDTIVKGVTETVILCEGLFDSKNITDLLDLKNNQSIKCCYTFKGNVSSEQLYRLQLKEVKKILLLYDSDIIEKTKTNAINLSKYFEVLVGFIDFKNASGEFKDPAELNKSEIVHVLKNMYSPLDFNLKKVQILDL